MARGVAIGVDVEPFTRDACTDSLPECALDAAEQRDLARLPAARRAAGFLSLLDAEGGCLKASGDGLAVPPAAIGVTGLDERPELRSGRAQLGGAWPVELQDLDPGSDLSPRSPACTGG